MASSSITRSAKRLLSKRNQIQDLYRKNSVWSPDFTVKSPFKDVEIPNFCVSEYIWKNLERWADKTAVTCGFSNREYTYHQLYKYSRNLATRLRHHFKLSDGDVICVMLPNLPEYPLVVLGGLQAGVVVTTINPIYTTHEVSRQLLLSKAKLIISSTENISVIKQAFQFAAKDMPIICIKEPGEPLPSGLVNLNDLVKDDLVDTSILKEVRTKPEDVCFLPYSSGTTGLPKGVEITNRNIVANCVQQDEEKIKQYSDTTKTHQDRSLAALPLFHIYGLSVTMLHKLSIGAKLVTVPRFQSQTFLRVLEKNKISLFYAAPPIVLFLGSHPEVKPRHLAYVDMFMCAAAPLPLADVDKLFAKAERKWDFLQGYGLTETSPLVTLMTRDTHNYSSVGFGIPNTNLRIVDPDMKVSEPNQVGELLVQGPQVMKGYRDNEEATRNAIIDDSWFKTGDLASINKDGSVIIHDRLKELIKVKGFQVPPAELEGVLKEHPDVLDAAVVGAPDQRLGEVPKAFVVMKTGHQAQEKDIQNFVAERVAEYKRIHKVIFLEELPKNPSGKILKRVLKEKYL